MSIINTNLQQKSTKAREVIKKKEIRKKGKTIKKKDRKNSKSVVLHGLNFTINMHIAAFVFLVSSGCATDGVQY